MIVLDENFPAGQRELLDRARIASRQIGVDLAQQGLTDRNVLPLLHDMAKPTYFSFDHDFFRSKLCHERYCLVWLDVRFDLAAEYVRRFLRHREFNTKNKRMGTVVQVAPEKIKCWRKNAKKLESVSW